MSGVDSDRVIHVDDGVPPTEVIEFLEAKDYEVLVDEETIEVTVCIPCDTKEVEEVLGVDPFDDRFEKFRHLVDYGLEIEFEVDAEGEVFVSAVGGEELEENINIS